jgi:hypothetical protein
VTDAPTPNHWRHVLKRKNEHMLYADDLGPTGTKLDVYFNETGTVKVTGQDGVKEMPYIARKGQKKLGLNATNCKTLETLTGSPDWKDWTGWFTLVVVRVSYKDMQTKQRTETDAIRISPSRPERKEPTGPQSRGSRTEGAAPTPDEQAEIARAERERS